MAEAGATRPVELLAVVKEAARQWYEEKPFTHGAALAYYALFSLAPLVLLSVSAAGLVFGEEAARGQLVQQIEHAVGPNVAPAIEEALRYAHLSRAGTLTTILGFVVLLIGAAGVFNQLQDSLNTIWEVRPRPDRTWGEGLRSRLGPFLMILLSGAVLFGMLLLNAALGLIDRSSPDLTMPGILYVWKTLDLVLTLAVTTVLFALTYKVLPDVSLRWKDVWVGAAVTALLFLLGSWLIGLYLRVSGLASVYGAAGSLVVVLLWVYYSSQVFLFGAELTHCYATRAGHTPPPKPLCERTPHGQRGGPH